ncbi:MAG TPA: glycosyltransferase family 4 protein [Devosiaceae bacterium]|jgi:glycosyltransferase involved in cell wall biosynthesis|nr:glycosyltransferase family 4 protein [Devosiaceae bacterium]
MAAHPRRILMTLDAIGGVWRYAMDLGAALRGKGVEILFVGLGPQPSASQAREAGSIGRLVWLDAPLDWTTDDEHELDGIPDLISNLVHDYDVDLVHLNLPSQACGLLLDVPVIVVSHSCVVTWFHAVRGTPLPEAWHWQQRRNRAGFDAAATVLAPSSSHADMLGACYGPITGLETVYNATRGDTRSTTRSNYVFAAGRWWDEGKNGAVLDQAAASSEWPVVMAGPTTGPGGQSLTLQHAEARGEIDNAEVRRLMAGAGIVVSPSIYEPFGLAALEAARAGAALVLADIPTYRELWDGAAMFADPHNPAALAEAINELAGDRILRRRLGQAARRRSELFTLDAQAAAMLGVYSAAIASAAPSLAGTG